jgi:hypothetical protein
MSIYYILVNKDKKEWIDTGDLGMGVKEWPYLFEATKLFGWLMIDRWIVDGPGDGVERQFNPKTDKIEADGGEFRFEGHWAHNMNVGMVSEYHPLYEVSYTRGLDENNKMIDRPNPDYPDWMNITVPAARDWNFHLKEWYGDSDDPKTQEWLKHQLLPLER